MAVDDVSSLESELADFFHQLTLLQASIQKRLETHADGKTLKGNELVGWLGEIYLRDPQK